MKKDNRFKNICPRKLDSPPSEPCQLALESINFLQTNNNSDSCSGCPWYINSAEHNYCFWKYAKTLDESVPDKEICQLLGITADILEKSSNSAISKLKNIKDEPYMQELRELIIENAENKNHDNTVYLPDEFRDKLKEEAEIKETDATEKKPKKIKKGMGMPLHKDGVKSDIWGIYSKKTLERIKKEKQNKKK